MIGAGWVAGLALDWYRMGCLQTSERFVLRLQQQTVRWLNELLLGQFFPIAHHLSDIGYFCDMQKTIWAPPSLFAYIANAPVTQNEFGRKHSYNFQCE